jgi:hypothetical protein
VRWKSSHGKFIGNTWSPCTSFTGLEVTPLESYFEGPLAITDVLIADNVFKASKGKGSVVYGARVSTESYTRECH